MRYLFLFLFMILFSQNTCAQEKDIWSGKYIIKKPNLDVLDSIQIEKTNDANIEELPHKYRSDLKRWTISSKSNDYKEKVELRRFLFRKENDSNEYEDFGWTKLHEQGKIACLDAHYFFICKTQPNTLVKINDEHFFSKTGIFGIRLHYGLFILEPYE